MVSLPYSSAILGLPPRVVFLMSLNFCSLLSSMLLCCFLGNPLGSMLSSLTLPSAVFNDRLSHPLIFQLYFICFSFVLVPFDFIANLLISFP